MGRPRLPVKVHRFHINLTLREEEDDDLIAFFTSIPERQRVVAVKMALRSGTLPMGLMSELADDKELADALDELLL